MICEIMSVSSLGPLVYTLDLVERILNRFCPFLAGGILVGSVYWTAVTYGAVTVMQVGEMFNMSDVLLTKNFYVVRFLAIKKV